MPKVGSCDFESWRMGALPISAAAPAADTLRGCGMVAPLGDRGATKGRYA